MSSIVFLGFQSKSVSNLVVDGICKVMSVGLNLSLSKTLTNNENTTSNYSNWDNKLIVRLLSKDSYNLKFAIDKILSYFFEGSKIPKIWNI